MFFSHFFLFFSLTAGSSKLLNSGVSLWTSVTNTPACSRTSFPAFSHAKLVCEPDCIEIFLAGRCDKALSLGTTNQAGSNLLENAMGVQTYNLRSQKAFRSTRTSKQTDRKEASNTSLSKKMKPGFEKEGRAGRDSNTESLPQKNSSHKKHWHFDLKSCNTDNFNASRTQRQGISRLCKNLQDSRNSPNLKTQCLDRVKEKLENSPEQTWVLSQLVHIKDSKLRPRKLSCEYTSTDSLSTESHIHSTDSPNTGVNKADVSKGTSVSIC